VQKIRLGGFTPLRNYETHALFEGKFLFWQTKSHEFTNPIFAFSANDNKKTSRGNGPENK
jgi:hypothetical protein